jgi:hypothetical protein
MEQEKTFLIWKYFQLFFHEQAKPGKQASRQQKEKEIKDYNFVFWNYMQ